MFKQITLCALSGFMLSGCVVHISAQKADVQLEQRLALATSEIQSLEIEQGSGDIHIESAEVDEIQVTAKVYTTKERNYQLSLSKSKEQAVLVAKHHSSSGFWHGDSPSIDLFIRLPKELSLAIDDGSGSIYIHNMANFVEIDDGSGNIEINNLDADLIVEDGSGAITISQVSGDLDVTDGSGAISIVDVLGAVTVNDGSGELTIKHVGGQVTIEDGSGDIDVFDVGGLNITNSGSGRLKVEGVKGEFNIDS
ncbi:DUF4097 family beta strand repeat-containing protein [Thalassotalea aquiviva]|uniref:DUF4097 family beta strand repeat-containing protein n=1 Tax=Thalassotalea aquiviva TaxID=3242415 RepID=UPI00352A0FC2